MGLTTRFGLVFGIALGLFVVLVIFGNLIGPPTRPNLDRVAGAPGLQTVYNFQQIVAPSRYFNPVTNQNLTKSLAAVIGRNIVELNPKGPRAFDSQGQFLGVAEADDVAEAALAEALKNFDQSSFRPAIDREQIKISDQQTKDSYKKSLAAILENHFLNSPLPWRNTSPETAVQIIGTYNVLLNQLYKLPAPPELVDYHRELLSVFTGQKLVLEAFKNSEADPLRAILAAEMVKNLNQELKSLLKNRL